MIGHHVAAIGWFAIRSNLRSPVTRAGLTGAGIVLMLGPLHSLVGGRGWALDPGLAFYGFLLALVFALRSGLEAQRGQAFNVFLAHNFVPPVVHAAAMLLSLALTWGLLLGLTFAALLVCSADPGLALWHTAAWGLRSAVVVGFVPFVERFSTVRLPLVVPAFGYLLVVVGLSVLIGEDRALDLFIVTRRSDPSTLQPLARQACLLLATTSVLFLGVAGRHPARRRSPEVIPSRHGSAPSWP